MMKSKITIPKIQKMKAGPPRLRLGSTESRRVGEAGEKITAITCYDFSFAKIVDKTGIEIVLVGDSLGMVIQGESNTLPVTVEQMIYHTACVARGLTEPLLVTDMPFMSYQTSLKDALRNAGQLMKKGKAESIKIEGGVEVAELIYRMNRLGIPVMGHIGLQPQSVHKYGGYPVRGKTFEEERNLLEDARAVEEAGAWAVVLEGVPREVSEKITKRMKIPTIGIGSGPECDGQILVLYDLLGLDPEFQPRFLKRYSDLFETVSQALNQYRKEVREKSFPSDEHSFRKNLINATDQFRKGNVPCRAKGARG